MERGKGRIVASLWKPKSPESKAKLTGVLRMSGVEYWISLVKNTKRPDHPRDPDYLLLANPKTPRDAEDAQRTDRSDSSDSAW